MLDAPVIKGDTPVKERQRLFEAFRTGEVGLLVVSQGRQLLHRPAVGGGRDPGLRVLRLPPGGGPAARPAAAAEGRRQVRALLHRRLPRHRRRRLRPEPAALPRRAGLRLPDRRRRGPPRPHRLSRRRCSAPERGRTVQLSRRPSCGPISGPFASNCSASADPPHQQQRPARTQQRDARADRERRGDAAGAGDQAQQDRAEAQAEVDERAGGAGGGAALAGAGPWRRSRRRTPGSRRTPRPPSRPRPTSSPAGCCHSAITTSPAAIASSEAAPSGSDGSRSGTRANAIRHTTTTRLP